MWSWTTRDFIGGTTTTASGNSCKTLSAIQRSDQKLYPFSAVIPVWRVKTSSSSSRDYIGITRKTAFENYCKSFSAIQRSDQKLWHVSAVIAVCALRRALQRVGIPYVLHGKHPPETRVIVCAQSNDRIKSYGMFQQLFQCGVTGCAPERLGIP
jgi:hypothetical protein